MSGPPHIGDADPDEVPTDPGATPTVQGRPALDIPEAGPIRRLWMAFGRLQDRLARPATMAGFVLPPLVLAAWIRLVLDTGRWPAGDGPHVLGTAMRLSQQLRDLELGTFAWCVNSLLGPHPPGAYMPALGAYTVLGTEWRGVHLVAGALVLWLCWDGIRRLGGGWVGAVFLGATGLVWLQAESYGIDLVGAAVAVQCLSWLVASDRLSRPRAVVAWGAWLGLAFVSKYTAPMFLWAPCLVAGFWVLRHRRFKALGLALGAWVVVAGPWLFPHLRPLLDYFSASQDSALLTNKALVTGAWYAPENAGWYPAALADAFGWPGLIALVVGALAWPRRRQIMAGAWIVPLSGVAGGMLVLMLQSQRQDRYALVAVPLLAALAGSSRVRFLLAPVGAMGLYGAGMVFSTWTDVPASRSYTHDLASAGASWPWVHEAYQPTSFDPTVWKLGEMVDAVQAAHGVSGGTAGFLLDDSGGAPTFGNVLSSAARAGHRWHVATVMVPDRGGSPAVFVGPFTTDDWPSRAFTTLLAITRTDDRVRDAWLTQAGLVEQSRWTLAGDKIGRLYVTADGQPLDLVGGELPPDTQGGGPP